VIQRIGISIAAGDRSPETVREKYLNRYERDAAYGTRAELLPGDIKTGKVTAKDTEDKKRNQSD
jgi:hypothetical protein